MDTPHDQSPAAGKTPPDSKKIKALLDMAAMQSKTSMNHNPLYQMLLIACGVVLLVVVLAYVAVVWAAHRY